MRFRDKVAIVIAGTAGIGKEVAHRFVEEGGSIVINGRNAERASTAAREIDPTGKRVAILEEDIDTPTTADAVVTTARERFGRLDVRFNYVGIHFPKSFLSPRKSSTTRFWTAFGRTSRAWLSPWTAPSEDKSADEVRAEDLENRRERIASEVPTWTSLRRHGPQAGGWVQKELRFTWNE